MVYWVLGVDLFSEIESKFEVWKEIVRGDLVKKTKGQLR